MKPSKGIFQALPGIKKMPVLLILSGCTIALFGGGIGWGVFPQLVKMKIIESKILTPGSKARKLWENPPFPLVFKAYIFNVTNYLATKIGAKPMLDEIGPYYFEEYKQKVILKDDEDADTVFFYARNTWYFNKEKSFPLTGNETVYVPHPALLGILYTAEKDQPTFLGLIGSALKEIFNHPRDIFLKSSAMDLLFGGNLINCTSKNILVRLVCRSIKEKGTFPEIEKNVFKFSIFGSRNGTKGKGLYQINRGTRHVESVGKLVTYDGKNEQTVWSDMPCNSIAGTDSTIYPPFIREQDLFIFSTDICRSLKVTFIRTSKYKGVDSLMYGGNLGDMSSNPEEKCFCPSPKKCLKRGVMDVTKCLGAPLIASLPHFYDSHEDYQNGVNGLCPNESVHGIVLQFEGLTGVPLEIKKRLQYSLPIRPIKNVKITKGLPKTFVPLVWIEEGIELSDEIMAELDSKLFKTLRSMEITKWTVTLVGGTVSLLGLWARFYNPYRAVSTPVATIS